MKASLSPSQFSKAFTGSKSLLAGDLLFKYKKEENPKLGFIVSKKYGNAVRRNQFKRRCRSKYSGFKKNGFKYTLIIKPMKQNVAWPNILHCFNILEQKINNA